MDFSKFSEGYNFVCCALWQAGVYFLFLRTIPRLGAMRNGRREKLYLALKVYRIFIYAQNQFSPSYTVNTSFVCCYFLRIIHALISILLYSTSIKNLCCQGQFLLPSSSTWLGSHNQRSWHDIIIAFYVSLKIFPNIIIFVYRVGHSQRSDIYTIIIYIIYINPGTAVGVNR